MHSVWSWQGASAPSSDAEARSWSGRSRSFQPRPRPLYSCRRLLRLALSTAQSAAAALLRGMRSSSTSCLQTRFKAAEFLASARGGALPSQKPPSLHHRPVPWKTPAPYLRRFRNRPVHQPYWPARGVAPPHLLRETSSFSTSRPAVQPAAPPCLPAPLLRQGQRQPLAARPFARSLPLRRQSCQVQSTSLLRLLLEQPPWSSCARWNPDKKMHVARSPSLASCIGARRARRRPHLLAAGVTRQSCFVSSSAAARL